MRIFEFLRASAIGLSALIIVGGLALIYGADMFFEDSATGELAKVDFENLVHRSGYLACPRFLCLSGEPDIETEVYDLPPTKLRALVLEYVESQPGISNRSADLELQQFEFVELTPTMRTPDVITIRIFPLTETSSTLAIYSHSPISDGNDGRNRERVERWLRMLGPAFGS